MKETTDSLDVVHSKSRRAYNLAAQRYHDLFHNEMLEKDFDRRLLDAFAARLPENSVVCDAGCGPSGHIGRYLFDKGVRVIGVDISDQCVDSARRYNPGMQFECGDIARLAFKDSSFDGVVSYYSIVHTPRRYVGRIFDEFYRILKVGGHLLLAVKEGATEGYISDLVGIKAEIYFSLFTEREIALYIEEAGFLLESMEKRRPYEFEISHDRIFVIARRSR